jgi:hypothetical protein
MKQTITLTAFVLLTAGGLRAQQTLSAAGAEASGTGGSASYTVGQVAYIYQGTSEGSVHAGVQQAYEIFTLGVAEIPGISLSCAVYPNPTVSFLTLTVKDISLSGLAYTLYDLAGQLIATAPVTDQLTTIGMETLPIATYILKVSAQGRELQAFQIIKH